MAGRVDPSYLSSIQTQTSKIRNFCILAHVDHGKTTLSDSLVSANGIISAKLAGKLRFLDSSEEEQKRGITMHSSAISLLYDLEDRKKGSETSEANDAKDEYLINLVDCPGHIDFSSDVSTATRLCDGALIVIDVLEGICTQTHAVLYKALKERMRPCLVLNKIDRLLIDMRLTTVEAFQHLRRLVENVNALAFTLLNSELLKRNDALNGDNKASINVSVINEGTEEEEDDPLVVEWTFSPEKGNVVFTGALDCWGFGIAKFANLWAKELGVNKNVLRKYLFEDYSFNSITKKITKCDPLDSNSSKPMFASMVLDPIWKVYELAIINQAPEKAAKMALNKLKVEIPPREINPRDPRATVQSIFRRWLPLSDAILRMVVRSMPSPIEAQQNRLFTLLPTVEEVAPKKTESDVVETNVIEVSLSSIESSIATVENSIAHCLSGAEDPLVVFVSKMMPVRVAELSPRDIALLNEKLRRKAVNENEDGAQVVPTLQPENEIFMALGRVYSGVLKRDSDIYVIGHRHDPLLRNDPNPDTEVDIHGEVPDHMAGVVTRVPRGSVGMYIMLGPSVFPVEEVTAGNIVGIIGLEEAVLKTATLCSTWAAYPMKAITFQAKPMVQVAIEPVSYADLKKLDAGLQQLFQYDPVCEVGVDENGQHTLVCLGELHLEQCVKSLTERFAKCEVKVSEPLISFRETVLQCESTYQPALPPPWSDMNGLSECIGGTARLTLGSENLSITFKCIPLPELLVKVLEEDPTTVSEIDLLLTEQQRRFSLGESVSKDLSESHFWDKVKTALETTLSEQTTTDSSLIAIMGDAKEVNVNEIISRMLSFGPRNGTNTLLFNVNTIMDIYDNKVPKSKNSKTVTSEPDNIESVLIGNLSLKTQSEMFHKVWSRINSSVIAGFHVAVAKGPLMHEPLHGVAFVIEKVEINIASCALSLTQSELSSVLTLETSDSNDSTSSNLIVTGQLISEVKETLWLSMLSCPVRLVEPIYQCDLQCDQTQLGNLYGVLSKRRGEVTKEDIIEGTSLFLLSAILPVVNSFGFAQELLKKTSGSGTAPQLSFAMWQVNALDPFWRPKTEDELEEYGEAGVSEHNLPRTFIDKVRKRKGLPIEEKIVAYGEKQRNMSKKK